MKTHFKGPGEWMAQAKKLQKKSEPEQHEEKKSAHRPSTPLARLKAARRVNEQV